MRSSLGSGNDGENYRLKKQEKIKGNLATNKRRSFPSDPLIRIKPQCICALYSDKKKKPPRDGMSCLGGSGRGPRIWGEEGNGMIDGPSRHERVKDKRGVRMAAGKAKGQPPAKRGRQGLHQPGGPRFQPGNVSSSRFQPGGPRLASVGSRIKRASASWGRGCATAVQARTKANNRLESCMVVAG